MSKDSVGNVATVPTRRLRRMPTGFTTYSMWTNAAIPATESAADSRAIEVKVKFRSDIDGVISAIRFYKGSQNTGTHTVSLWSATGELLARAVSTVETASGWQQVDFPAVNISANTTYIASYHTTAGYYSFNPEYFSQYNKPALHALGDEASGGNGEWQTSATPALPTQVYLAGNFWVDVVFGAVVAPQ